MARELEQMAATIAAWDCALAALAAPLVELEAVPVAPSTLAALAIAQQRIGAAQQGLIQAIAALGADPHPGAATLAPRLQAIALEMHKQLRLLQTDQQFLPTARRPDTVIQRRSQMQGRIALLQRYGAGVRSLLTDWPTDPAAPSPPLDQSR